MCVGAAIADLSESTAFFSGSARKKETRRMVSLPAKTLRVTIDLGLFSDFDKFQP